MSKKLIADTDANSSLFHADGWPIPLSRYAAMSYLLFLVSIGYVFWNSGTCPMHKAVRFVGKMRERYGVGATDIERRARQRRGLANAQLIVTRASSRSYDIRWWLLATAGRGDVQEQEPLKDALKHPPTFGRHYRLAQERGKWTWLMTRETVDGWTALLEAAAISGCSATAEQGRLLAMQPMFGGIKRQVLEINEAAHRVWRKHQRGPYPDPLPNPLPGAGRTKVYGDATLSGLLTVMETERRLRGERAADELRLMHEQPNRVVPAPVPEPAAPDLMSVLFRRKDVKRAKRWAKHVAQKFGGKIPAFG